MEGPDLPPTAELPALPSKVQWGISPGGVGLSETMKMGLNVMNIAKTQGKDPHLSAEDNLIALSHATQEAVGRTAFNDQLLHALQVLERDHLPEGLCGFLITEPPKAGTLGQQ